MKRKTLSEGGDDMIRQMRETLQSLKSEIEANGGTVLEFGFHIGRSRKSQLYRDKELGEERKSKSIHPRLASNVIGILETVVQPDGSEPF